jgi:hypothetical protein
MHEMPDHPAISRRALLQSGDTRKSYVDFCEVNFSDLTNSQVTALGKLVRKLGALSINFERASGNPDIKRDLAKELNSPVSRNVGFRIKDVRTLEGLRVLRGDWGDLAVEDGFLSRFNELKLWFGNRKTILDQKPVVSRDACHPQ